MMSLDKINCDKLEIIHWISELQDKDVIGELKALMKAKPNPKLTQKEKKAIDDGLESMKEGTESYELILKETKEKFPHLF